MDEYGPRPCTFISGLFCDVSFLSETIISGYDYMVSITCEVIMTQPNVPSGNKPSPAQYPRRNVREHNHKPCLGLDGTRLFKDGDDIRATAEKIISGEIIPPETRVVWT